MSFGDLGLSGAFGSDRVGGFGDLAMRSLEGYGDAAKRQQQYDMQKEFAQHGIRWRVEDARAAGIHPLAALGAQLTSYAPQMVGDHGDIDSGSGVHPGRLISQMGQNISRAIQATKTAHERKMDALNLEFRELKNEYLKSQIAQNKATVGPPLPSNSGLGPLTLGRGSWRKGDAYVIEEPLRRTHSGFGNPGRAVGAVPDYAYARTEKGLAIVPSRDVKEQIEDQIIPETMWALRNQLLPTPMFKGLKPPSTKEFPLPKGMVWSWSPMHQEFRPVRRGRHLKEWTRSDKRSFKRAMDKLKRR